MQKLTFEFSVENVNVILRGLSKLPFEEVSKLISEIHEQANLQLIPSEEKQP